MASHVTITIKVAYDEAAFVPGETDLAREISRAIGDGMLSPSRDEIIEDFSVEIEDATVG